MSKRNGRPLTQQEMAVLAQLQVQQQGPGVQQVLFHQNDIQLVANVAAACPGPADEAVARAVDIIAHAMVAVVKNGAINKKAEEIMLAMPQDVPKPALEVPPEL